MVAAVMLDARPGVAGSRLAPFEEFCAERDVVRIHRRVERRAGLRARRETRRRPNSFAARAISPLVRVQAPVVGLLRLLARRVVFGGGGNGDEEEPPRAAALAFSRDDKALPPRRRRYCTSLSHLFVQCAERARRGALRRLIALVGAPEPRSRAKSHVAPLSR